MLVTRKRIARKLREDYRLSRLTPHFIVNRDELRAKVLDHFFEPFAWPGGYTITFVDESGELLCRDCAINHVYGYDVSDIEESREGIEKNHRVYSQVYWEGATENCADCGKEIQSQYGEVSEDSADES